jgi:autotransporter-associated beta strand protein
LKALALIATWVSCTCFGTSTVHAATYSWTGATNTDFTNGGNWVEGSWEQWSDYNFGSSVTSGTATINGYFGIASLNLVSGLDQDIVINSSNPQPVIMGVNVAGNANALISIAADSRDLTINGEYISATPVTWDIGAGRTFTMNGPLNNWWANAGIVKNGAGTAVLSQASNYAAGTTINGGIVAATRGTLGSGNVVVNNGGVLLVNDQWVFSGVNPYGENPGSRASLTVNAGGEFRLDPISGFANGVVNLYLNGGSVTGGAGDDGRGALYLFEGNEQITAGGATTSTIASVLRLTGNNNSITVSDSSTLQITAAVANANWFGSPTPGGFVKSGNGTLVLTGQNSYTGATVVDGGTLVLPNGDWVTGQPWNGSGATGPITVGSGAALSTSAGVTQFQNGLTLNGGSLSSRGLTYPSEWRNIVLSSNVTAGGTATSTIASSMNVDGNRTFTVGDGSTLTVTGELASWYGSGGGLTKAGAGTLALQAANSYYGGTTINSGTISISAASADNGGYTSLGTGDVTINGGGTLVSAGNWSTGNEWNSGNVGKITVNNGGTWTINTVGNTVRNGLELNGGTINGTGANPDWGGLYLRSTYLTASGSAISTVAVDTALNGETTFTVDAGSQLNFSGMIHNKFQANGGVTKAGSGTLLLSGSNTYSGATQVNAGTLAVNGSLGATAVSVASGATLAGSGSLAGAVNVLGTLSPGNSPGVITLGSLVLGGTSTTLIEITGTTRGTQYDGVDITTSGGLTYGGLLSLDFSGLVSAVADGTTFDIFSFGGSPSSDFSSVISTGLYSGTWNSQGGGIFELVSGGQTLTFSQASGDIIVVPEPGTLALAGLGFAAAAAAWRRRRVRRCPGSVTA